MKTHGGAGVQLPNLIDIRIIVDIMADEASVWTDRHRSALQSLQITCMHSLQSVRNIRDAIQSSGEPLSMSVGD
jgi:hypothetical protein